MRLVYCNISPPISIRMIAMTALPKCRARIVLSLTNPKVAWAGRFLRSLQALTRRRVVETQCSVNVALRWITTRRMGADRCCRGEQGCFRAQGSTALEFPNDHFAPLRCKAIDSAQWFDPRHFGVQIRYQCELWCRMKG